MFRHDLIRPERRFPMTRRGGILTLLFAVLVPSVPLAAQDPGKSEDGQRSLIPVTPSGKLTVGGRVKVNVAGPEAREMQGVFLGVEGSEFLISPEGQSGVLRLQSDRIDRVQVPVGERGQAMKGAGYGAAGGALLGVVLGLASGDDPDSCWLFCYTAEEKAALGGASLGIVGGVVGLIAGALTKETVWNDVTPPRMRPSIRPSRTGAVELRLSLSTGR